jgi:hypothetical protein
MKKRKDKQVRIGGILSALSAALLIFYSVNLYAADVQISLTATACEVSASTPGGDGCDTGQCNGEAGCVCVAKGDFITWTLGGNEKYKMKFSGDSPLKDNCGKNFKQGERKCKVKEEVVPEQSYAYEVMLEKCANGSDPRIIIKNP